MKFHNLFKSVFKGKHEASATVHGCQRNEKQCNMTSDRVRRLVSISASLEYIGIEPEDFALKNEMFARPLHPPIHGIGHIYRTMIACALLGTLLQRKRDALLAFCGAYIHDLARSDDGVERLHGENAAKRYFSRFNAIWDKYHLTEEERQYVCMAVTQHSCREWMAPSDKGYHVMAILKDADALDRCRINDLNPHFLRYAESRLLIRVIEHIYLWTKDVNNDIGFKDFLDGVPQWV